MEIIKIPSRQKHVGTCFPAWRNVRRHVSARGFPVLTYKTLYEVAESREDPLFKMLYGYSLASSRICVNEELDTMIATVSSTLQYYLDESRVSSVRDVLLTEERDRFTHAYRMKVDDVMVHIISYLVKKGLTSYDIIKDWGHLEPPRTFYSISHVLTGAREVKVKLPPTFVTIRYSQKVWWLKWSMIRAYLFLKYGIH